MQLSVLVVLLAQLVALALSCVLQVDLKSENEKRSYPTNPEAYLVDMGTEVTITCSEGGQVVRDGHTGSSSSPHKFEADQTTQSTYTCACGSVGSVRVFITTLKPAFSEVENSRKVCAGENVSISCLEDNPNDIFGVRWLFRDEASGSSESACDLQGYHCASAGLTISNASPKHRGNYLCRIASVNGYKNVETWPARELTSAATQLTVAEPGLPQLSPSPTEGEYSAGESVTFTCSGECSTANYCIGVDGIKVKCNTSEVRHTVAVERSFTVSCHMKGDREKMVIQHYTVKEPIPSMLHAPLLGSTVGLIFVIIILVVIIVLGVGVYYVRRKGHRVCRDEQSVAPAGDCERGQPTADQMEGVPVAQGTRLEPIGRQCSEESTDGATCSRPKSLSLVRTLQSGLIKPPMGKSPVSRPSSPSANPYCHAPVKRMNSGRTLKGESGIQYLTPPPPTPTPTPLASVSYKAMAAVGIRENPCVGASPNHTIVTMVQPVSLKRQDGDSAVCSSSSSPSVSPKPKETHSRAITLETQSTIEESNA